MKKLFNVLTLALIFISAHAQFSGAGSGTSSDPYQITNANELAEMAYFLGDSHKGTCFQLMNDINLDKVISWCPIGTTSSNSFRGNFEGNNHTIYGLQINDEQSDILGLFGYTFGATLSNIQIKVNNILGSSNVGALCGYASGSSIINCSVQINQNSFISGTDKVGGIIGTSQASTISNCNVVGNISGESFVGGIIGYLISNNTVSDCSMRGSVIGTSNSIGGIAGEARTINKASVGISKCFSFVDISGQNYIGGILGYHYTDGTGGCGVNNCYSIGNFSGNEYIGGIVGAKSRGGVVYCYSKGVIKGYNYAGGICGSVGMDGSIGACFNIMDTIKIERENGNCGRMASLSSYPTSTSNNFSYDKCVVIAGGKEQIIDTKKMYNGKDCTVSELKEVTTYSNIGWNFDDLWAINEGKSFPYFSREKKVENIILTNKTLVLTVGETYVLQTQIIPSDADCKDLEWISSNEAVATVEKGVITAIGNGNTVITAATTDGSIIEASCYVTVTNNGDFTPADFENVVYMESFIADAGEQVELPILMKNKIADEIADFDFYLQLPDGISAILDEEGYPIVTLSTERTTNRKHSVLGEIDGDGMIHVYSSSIRNTYFFSGTEGEVATITLKVADDASDGIYHIAMRNISMKRISEEEPYSVARFNLSAAIGDLSIVKSIADGESYFATENEHVDKLNYTRTFNNTTWQALYVPFSIPVAVLEENGLQVAELNDSHMYDRDDDGVFEEVTIEFLRLTSGSTEANMPYMIRALEASEKQITLTDVELKAAAEVSIDCSTTKKLFTFTGTYSGVDGETMFANHYYAISGGALKPAANSSVGLKPQRWYMSIENRDGSQMEYNAPSIRLMVNGEWAEEIEEETTGLHTIGQAQQEDKIYTLEGVRVLNASRPGMYVQNGKIVVRK